MSTIIILEFSFHILMVFLLLQKTPPPTRKVQREDPLELGVQLELPLLPPRPVPPPAPRASIQPSTLNNQTSKTRIQT